MEHLDRHPHAFIDENNVVFNVSVFADHNVDLLESIREHLKAKQYVSCCEYGFTAIGATFLGDKFSDSVSV